MQKELKESKIKIIKSRIPKNCVCPKCGVRQPFKKAGEHWKMVKEMNIDNPLLLKTRTIRAKCLNPNCSIRTFILPTPGKDIIAKLDFSGILTLDEYKPKRSDNYSLIAGDAIKQRILYIEPVLELFGRGEVIRFLEKLVSFGIKPWAIVFDLWAAYPKQVKKVWPDIIIQYDYFHVMQWIHKYLKNALLQFRKELKEKSLLDMRSEIWEHKWRLLKNMDKWTPEDHRIIQDLIQVYTGTIVEKVLLFKEQLYHIFDLSSSKEEAYAKRDVLFQEKWWQSSWHLSQAMNFLMSPKFEYMVTYLENPEIPRSGNLENLNSVWRQIESARFGFKTDKGRLDHLKLYQISKYLQGNFP